MYEYMSRSMPTTVGLIRLLYLMAGATAAGNDEGYWVK
jgi:hypothetical protein